MANKKFDKSKRKRKVDSFIKGQKDSTVEHAKKKREKERKKERERRRKRTKKGTDTCHMSFAKPDLLYFVISHKDLSPLFV